MGIQINGQTDTVTATDGSINVGGDVTIPGVLTYEDVTNVDSVGIVTAQSGINVTGGNVKIGTTTAGQSEADDLTIATSAHTGMTIRSGATSKGAVYFSDGTSGNSEYRGYVEYNHQDDHLRFGTAAAEKVRITSAGNIGIGENTPETLLHLSKNGGQATITLEDPSNSMKATLSAGTTRLDIGTPGSHAISFFTNNTHRLRITPEGSALLTTDGQNTQYSYAMKLGQGAYLPNDSTAPHYGLWVRQLGPRYELNYGVYSEVEDDNGFYGGETLDGLSSVRGVGVYGASPVSNQSYQKGIGVYGKATNATYNYNTVIGVRGRVETGTTTFAANNGQLSYGGHFVATGKSDVVGVYADAFLAGSPGANQEAIPLLVSSNGSEKLRVTSTGNLGIGYDSPSQKLVVKGTTSLMATNSTNQWMAYTYTDNTLRLNYNGAGADELTIDSAGRIGIGIVNPNRLLQVNGASGGNGQVLISTNGAFSGTDTADLSFRVYANPSNGNAHNPQAQIQAVGTGSYDAALTFKTAVGGSDNNTPLERLRITSSGNIGINCNSPGSMLELNAAAGTKMGISLGAVGDNITASRYIGICKTADQTDLAANSGFQGIEFGGPSSANEGYLAFHTHDLGVESGERIRLTKDGKFGVGLTAPETKVQIRDTTTYGKDTYASANTGGSQTPPPGTFKWDNVTPVAGHGRGYEAYVQSGDAYPNASNYIDVLIRNAGFYRITLKRSHSSADAAVCQMLIYGLANSGNSNYPVVHMNGAMGSGTSTATVQSGNGRGSSNAVASFYWEIHSYNVNTHDSIIRITTTGSNNQGIVALIEEI